MIEWSSQRKVVSQCEQNPDTGSVAIKSTAGVTTTNVFTSKDTAETYFDQASHAVDLTNYSLRFIMGGSMMVDGLRRFRKGSLFGLVEAYAGYRSLGRTFGDLRFYEASHTLATAALGKLDELTFRRGSTESIAHAQSPD